MEEKKRVVLVVEDDESIAGLIRINLTLTGFKPVMACDGEEAVLLFQNTPVDLVLLDLMLPGKDGWEVLSYIKEQSHGKVPVIIVSARTQRADIEKGFSMGVADYVTKPFDPLDLVEKIKNILHSRNVP